MCPLHKSKGSLQDHPSGLFTIFSPQHLLFHGNSLIKLSALMQDKPPVPANDRVNIESAGKETFAVSQFGGFLVDDYSLSSKAKALEEALNKDDVQHESDSFFTAGYDPPYRLQHRCCAFSKPYKDSDRMGIRQLARHLFLLDSHTHLEW